MKLGGFSAGTTDWSQIPPSVAPGTSGTATARMRQFGDLQLRLIEYSVGYVADHWCSKGHIVFVVSGQIAIEHQDGSRYAVMSGMSYQVSDSGPAHRLLSSGGATIFVVD